MKNNSFFLKVQGSNTDKFSYDLTVTSLFKKYDNCIIHVLGKPYFVDESKQDLFDFIYEKFLAKDNEISLYLDGKFIIIIEDSKNEQVIIYNDGLTVGSFYYNDFICNSITFASSFTDVIKEKGFKKQINKKTLCNYLSNGFNVSDETMIDGICRSMPTFYYIISASGIKKSNCWNKLLKFREKKITSLESRLDEYEKTYQDALKKYIDINKPSEVGILLSGGHDTSFLMIHLAKVWKKPIHAYSVVFPGWDFDEASMARNICEENGGKFHPVEFGPKDLSAIIGLITACEEPVVGSSLPLFVLANRAKLKTNVIMGGDAGDTLWGEYYPVGEYHRWVKHLPLFGRKTLYKFSSILRKITDWERFWELEHVAQLFAEKNIYSSFLRKLCTYRHFNKSQLRNLISYEFIPEIKFSKGSLEVPFSKESFDRSLISGKLFNGFLTYQGYHTDRAMKFCDIDFFMPNTDKNVMKFITDLPVRWLNGGHSLQRLSNSKKINRLFHKKALQRHLSLDKIYNRSFDIPWFRVLLPQKELLKKLVNRLNKRGWFSEGYLDQLLKEFLSQPIKKHEILELKNHGYRLFTLLSLEVWCTIFLDGSGEVDSKLSLEELLS